MLCRYFYDLPVYRLPRENYNKARDEYVENMLSPIATRKAGSSLSMEAMDRNSLIAWRNHLQQSYGGCWEFNEIVGYIRLHFLGTQVRGEYFGSPKKRIVRTRKKFFEYKTLKLAPEVPIEPPQGNSEIVSAVREYIDDCRHELPRRYIDAAMFEALAPYINWVDLLHGD